MSGAFDQAGEKKRISFNGPEGKHLLQVALAAHTASPQELKELAVGEELAHWGRLREIEWTWGDPDEPPVAERWHERQDYKAICDAISNPQEYVRQARQQGLLPASESEQKETQSHSYADNAVNALRDRLKHNLSVGNEQPSGEQAPSLERSERAERNQKYLSIPEKSPKREQDSPGIDI